MNKKIILGLIGILLVSVVIAQVISFNFNNASFTPTSRGEITRYSGVVTFNCGGRPSSIYLNEPSLDIDDDFEQAVREVCNEVVTNVQDWTGRTYKQSSSGLRSFDDLKLREDECRFNEGVYNRQTQVCDFE